MTNDYYEEQGNIEQWRDDNETERLLDKACEGVELPTEEQPKGMCEDAPCCGCCGDSMDDGYGTYADDAWHDAQEYPEW